MTHNKKVSLSLIISILISWLLFISFFDLFKFQEMDVFKDNATNYSFIMFISYIFSMILFFNTITRIKLVLSYTSILLLDIVIANLISEDSLPILSFFLSVVIGLIVGSIGWIIFKVLIKLFKRREK